VTVPDLAAVAERVWYGRGTGAVVARAALSPLSLLFRAGVAVRAAAYDARGGEALPAPSVSVGNLTVGGTGKTPVAAWVALWLLARGARPAIVLRGYGDDEPRVHALLNPSAVVVASPDRVAGAREAVARGADVVVLDDAFQHRRARRDVDLVLVSADRWTGDARLLPAGPFREPLSALRRATAVVVTRKAASEGAAERAVAVVSAAAPWVPVAVAALPLDALRPWNGAERAEERPLSELVGRRVLGVAAIGDPGAFFAQLEGVGATVERAAFADHHAFSDADVAGLARRAEHADAVICTLKDAVKLGPRWPRLAPPLWYVSQRVVVERGAGELEALLETLLAARRRGQGP
jgi:tetraacyldisaccharide 4'-kinase